MADSGSRFYNGLAVSSVVVIFFLRFHVRGVVPESYEIVDCAYVHGYAFGLDAHETSREAQR